ncbi:MAG: ergothioneine biosynthesis protein EgtB [Alphaproteobacteria bacterium]
MPAKDWVRRYAKVRGNSIGLVEGLSDADATAQSMNDASPAKWHLAHTTWFFEEFVVAPRMGDSERFHPSFSYLFNSYYNSVGDRHARPSRGLLTRPSLDEVKAYRAHVDANMAKILSTGDEELRPLLDLGLAHEEQHQELLLTDILHLFAQNPLRPAFRPPEPVVIANATHSPVTWHQYGGGQVRIGASGDSFIFDCEGPEHDVLLLPFTLASRAVTNREWLEFMRDGGYADPLLWLSDGFATVNAEGWQAPLYWKERDGDWVTMTLRGERAVDPDAPVTHVSHYEADAYARWAGARLPTEVELESAVAGIPIEGNFVTSGAFAPRPQQGEVSGGPCGLFGDVWEWTSSPYVAYPRYAPAAGAIGEYNGKFMSGQMVLRGGSCATAGGHMRPTYRNFFHPDKRWQFSGLRLARDL